MLLHKLLDNLSKEKLLSLFTIVCIFTVLYSLCYIEEFNHNKNEFLENNNNLSINNLLHKLYFTLVTTSTIGYGDITPKSMRVRMLMCIHTILIMYISFS